MQSRIHDSIMKQKEGKNNVHKEFNGMTREEMKEKLTEITERKNYASNEIKRILRI